MELQIDNFTYEETFLNFSVVSENIKHTILQLLQDESQFNSNDVLVNLDHVSVLPYHSESFDLQNQQLKSILKTAGKIKKEQGIFPLCLTQGIIEWEYKQKTVVSPLFLFPCEIEIKKVNNSIKIQAIEEAEFINPFLINRLNKEFSIEIPSEIKKLEELVDFLKEKGLNSVDAKPSFLGNFHHHRFEIIKELEELSDQNFSIALSGLLGDETISSFSKMELGSELLFPSDIDQLAVFSTLENNHTVVQGPPGTGKSQVLSNVLAKVLRNSFSAIVVSEKRVALEVLQKKLQQFHLGDLCFIATSETLTKDVLISIKKRWSELEGSDLNSTIPNMRISEQYTNQLQQQIDILNKEQLIGGLSYFSFQEFLQKRDLTIIPFSSDLPDMKEWLIARDTVKELFDLNIQNLVGRISYGLIQQDFFKQLDKTIHQNLETLSKINIHFELNTWIDVQKAMKKAALCQNFNNPTFRKHALVLTPNSKEQKRFIKLRKKFLQLHILQSHLNQEKNHWLNLPSLLEAESLLDLEKDTSLFGKWKFKKQWTKYTLVDKNKANEILHKWKQFIVNEDQISQIKIELCEIGIEDVNSELELVHQQIHFFTLEDRLEWLKIPAEERHVFAEYNSTLNQFYSQLKSNFRLEESTNLHAFFTDILKNFSILLQEHSNIKKLPEIIQRTIKSYKSFEEYELFICKSNWVKCTTLFPAFSNFKQNDLLDKCHSIISSGEEESTYLAQTIRKIQLERFRYYHQLLQTSPAKLQGAEKQLRLTLKRGKAILVKEFSKTRNHPSLRELFASDAQEWLRLFKPIWLSNPTQIAKCFPMQQGLFDFAIFDEASQIPLQNALGTIQRSNRVLIAGDQQQMGPSNYFKASSGEVTDLLHQASFYWKNCSLKHHYRSENPELIYFSNKHFYNNELLAYPSVQQEKKPIEWHYFEEGRFNERVNQLEAKEVAQIIEKQIDNKDHLGIVAFSELQLAEIYACLNPKTQEKLENRIEEDTAFFKALENVQGEECDHLIISMAYGKNEEGEFHMRFGPLNSKNGSKRLNVLLTRARKKIDFFSSVKASYFKLSSNEAINFLRLFLLQIENQEEKKNHFVFPLKLNPTLKGNKVQFSHIYTKIHQAEELVTLVRTMESRGWEVDFVD